MSSLLHRQVRPSGVRLALEPGAAKAIEAHAVEGYPAEVVGILAGTTDTVTEAVRLQNRNTERARDRYVVDGLELMRAERAIEARGLQVLGYYHSHPDHPAMYSDTDRDLALPNMAYLIAAVHGGEAPSPRLVETRCWRLHEDRAEMLEDHLALP